MEKKEYIKPEIEIIELEQEDIIRTSTVGSGIGDKYIGIKDF